MIPLQWSESKFAYLYQSASLYSASGRHQILVLACPEQCSRSRPSSSCKGTEAKQDGPDKMRASEMEAATCDRFGNPVLSLEVKTPVGRALATQEDFQGKRLPAFSRFRGSGKAIPSTF